MLSSILSVIHIVGLLIFLQSGCPSPWAWTLICSAVLTSLVDHWERRGQRQPAPDLVAVHALVSLILTVVFVTAWVLGWPPPLPTVLSVGVVVNAGLWVAGALR